MQVAMPESVEGTAAEVCVYTAGGQLLQRVASQGNVLLDLSGFLSGVYIIRVGNAVARW